MDRISVQRRPWAILRDALGDIAKVLSKAPELARELSEEEREARTAADQRMAALRSERLTGGVAIIPLTGVITPTPSLLSILFGGGGGLQTFRSQFRDAIADDDVGSILIDIDSPGGLVDLVPETAEEIRAARGTKPIVAIANTLAASAAYWIGSQADEFVVTPSGLVGSIGVVIVHEDWSSWNEQFGIDPTYITAGKYKAEANMDEPLSEDAKAHLQERVDDSYALFTAAVAAGRGASEQDVREGYGEGRVLTAERAVSAGLADRVATFEQTVGQMVGRASSAAASALADLATLRAMVDEGTLTADEAREALGLPPAAAEVPEPTPEPEPEREEPEPDAPADDDAEADEAEADSTTAPRGGGDPEQDRRKAADVLFA